MTRRIIHITREQLLQAIDKYKPFKTKAAIYLGVSYDTFRRRCIEEGIYRPSLSINRKTLSKDFVIDCIQKTTCGADAARLSGKSYAAFKRHALAYGVWKPNPRANKGKHPRKPKVKVENILLGLHPHLSSSYVKDRLIKADVFKYECNVCQLKEWQNKPIVLQLDHINGNNTDHKRNNLRLLCPNCHAQTDNFCGKNKRK